jgi:hypothetical protein
MKRTTVLTLVLALSPAALCGQASGAAQATGTSKTTTRPASVSSSAKANASTQVQLTAPKGWSAEGSAKLEAMYAGAKEKNLPPEPIARRVAEGSAKGSDEATILASAGTVKSNMEASQEAMVAAGHKNPTGEEAERGAMVMEHGVTQAQLEAVVRHSDKARSLVVAFDVLSRLAARGVPVTQAIAQVESKLDANSSDQAIISLAARGSGNAAAGTTGAGSAGTSASAAGAVTGATKGVTAGITGTVTGVVKKP